MGQKIHTIQDPQKGALYRVWSSTSEGYITGVLTKDQLKVYLLVTHIRSAIVGLFPGREIPEDVFSFDQAFALIGEQYIERDIMFSLPGARQPLQIWQKERTPYKKDSTEYDWTLEGDILKFASENFNVCSSS